MKIAKAVVVFLNEYDNNSKIEVAYYCKNMQDSLCPFVSYSFSSDKDFSIAQMVKNNDYYHLVLEVEKNNDFFFSIIDNNSDEYHLYLGDKAQNCKLIKNENKEDIIKEEIIEENNQKALVPVENQKLSVVKKKKLKFAYRLNKRIRIMLIKLYRILPSYITGNYRRRINL